MTYPAFILNAMFQIWWMWALVAFFLYRALVIAFGKDNQ